MLDMLNFLVVCIATLTLFRAVISEPAKIECFWSSDGAQLRCVRPEEQDIGKGPRWSNFLGVGPVRTGSSAMFTMLEKHNGVSIGDAARGGAGCCGSELYSFWTPTEPLAVKGGVKWYSSFFDQRIPSIEMAGERTPMYSYDTLAAYRAGAMLHRPVKLIFTIRDELESDISLYLMRGFARKFKIDYSEWIKPRVAVFQNYLQCRRDYFKTLAITNSTGGRDYLSVAEINNPAEYTWQTAGLIENFLYRKCKQGRPATRPLFEMTDFIQERLHAANLRRWIHVFGRENLLCIQNEDMLRHPQLVQTAVTEFLGLDQAGWHGFVQQPHMSKYNGTSFEIELQRLQELHRSLHYPEQVIEPALKLLNDTLNAAITTEDRALVAELCPLLSKRR